MAFCGHCGHKVDESLKFCTFCGAPVQTFCGHCGAKVAAGSEFCTSCAAPLRPAAPKTASTSAATTSTAGTTNAGTSTVGTNTAGTASRPASSQNDFQAKIAALKKAPDNTTDKKAADNTAAFDEADAQQNKVMAVLAYLSWLVLIPIFAARESKFARFHANQGLVLAITEVGWMIATVLLFIIFFMINVGLAYIILLILGLTNFVFPVMTILGIVNAVKGRAKGLPVIGKFRILK